jgi:hypothetical protein
VIDAPVADYKPASSDDATTAQTKCKLLSQVAASHGVAKLIIAFEGLLSFDDAGTTAFYEYIWDLNHGVSASEPTGGSAGYVLHELITPVIEQHRADTEFLMFPETSQSDSSGSAPEACAIEWAKVAGRKLFVIGHSYGGHAANQLAEVLDSDKITIAGVVTIDPRTKYGIGTLGRTRNAVVWDNFFQTNTPFLNGATVPGADENVDLSNTGVQHTGMPGMPQVKSAVLDLLK